VTGNGRSSSSHANQPAGKTTELDIIFVGAADNDGSLSVDIGNGKADDWALARGKALSVLQDALDWDLAPAQRSRVAAVLSRLAEVDPTEPEGRKAFEDAMAELELRTGALIDVLDQCLHDHDKRAGNLPASNQPPTPSLNWGQIQIQYSGVADRPESIRDLY
jgi:hypothetical protein